MLAERHYSRSATINAMRLFFFSLLFFSCLTPVYLQVNHDVSTINAKLDTAYEHLESNRDQAEMLVQIALQEAESAGASTEIAMAYNFLGMIYRDKNKPDEALDYLFKSYKLRTRLGLEARAANVLNNIASVYRQKGAFVQAQEYAMQALAVHEKHNDIEGQQADFLELANIYEREGSPEKSNEWLYKRWINDADTARNAKTAYSLANNYLRIHLDSALHYALYALSFYEKDDDRDNTLKTKGLLADIYLQRGELENAKRIFSSLIPDLEKLTAPEPLLAFSVNNNYAYFLLQQKQPDSALTILYKARNALGSNEQQYIAEREKLALNLTDAFFQRNQLDSAFHFQKEARRYNEMLYDESKAKSMETERYRSNLQTSMLESAILHRQRSILIGLAALSLVILLFVFIAWQRYRKNMIIKQQQEALRMSEVEKLIRDEEIRIRTQMIDRQDEERKRLASELHEGVGGALMTLLLNLKQVRKSNESAEQLALNQSIKTVDQTYTEIRAISHEMRSGELAKTDIRAALESLCARVSEAGLKAQVYFHGLDTTHLEYHLGKHLYRIAQELVTNTLKHSGASEVAIQLNRFGQELRFVYEDNGKGFRIDKDSKGIGLINIEDRVHAIGGTLSFDSREGGGFTCFIEIPDQVILENINARTRLLLSQDSNENNTL